MKRKMGEINDRTRPEFLLYLTSGQTIYPHSPEEGAVSELDGREKNKQTNQHSMEFARTVASLEKLGCN